MSKDADETQHRTRMMAELADLSEQGLALARAVQQRLLAAKTSEEVAELSRTFARVTKSVLEAVALEARLHNAGQRASRLARAESADIARIRDEFGLAAKACGRVITFRDFDMTKVGSPKVGPTLN